MIFTLIAALQVTNLFKRGTCGTGTVSLPSKYNVACGSCIMISCGKEASLAQVSGSTSTNTVNLESNFYNLLCAGISNPNVYWSKTPCSPVPVPKPTSVLKLYKPVIGEIWKRGQSTGAIIEWLQGSTTPPAVYPTYINLYFVDLNFKRVHTITTWNEAKWSRWIFGIQVGTNINLVPNLPDGKYFIQACNSHDENYFTYSNMVQIKGQIESFEFKLLKPVGGEVWSRGQSGPIIQWLQSSEPNGYPSSIHIYVLDVEMHRVFTIATYNPSSNLKWTFGYAVGSNPNLVPNGLPDGDYYIQIVDTIKPSRIATSGKIRIQGGSDYVQAVSELLK